MSFDWKSRLEAVISEDPEFAQSPFGAQTLSRLNLYQKYGGSLSPEQVSYLEQLIRGIRQQGKWREWRPDIQGEGGTYITSADVAWANIRNPNAPVSGLVPMASGGFITASRPEPRPPEPVPAPETLGQFEGLPEAMPVAAVQPPQPQAPAPPAPPQQPMPPAIAPEQKPLTEREKILRRVMDYANDLVERAREYETFAEQARNNPYAHSLTNRAAYAYWMTRAQNLEREAVGRMLDVYRHMSDEEKANLRRQELGADMEVAHGLMGRIYSMGDDELARAEQEAMKIRDYALRAHVLSAIDNRRTLLRKEGELKEIAKATRGANNKIKAAVSKTIAEIRGIVDALNLEGTKDPRVIAERLRKAADEINLRQAAFVGAMMDLIATLPPKARPDARALLNLGLEQVRQSVAPIYRRLDVIQKQYLGREAPTLAISPDSQRKIIETAKRVFAAYGFKEFPGYEQMFAKLTPAMARALAALLAPQIPESEFKTFVRILGMRVGASLMDMMGGEPPKGGEKAGVSEAAQQGRADASYVQALGLNVGE